MIKYDVEVVIPIDYFTHESSRLVGSSFVYYSSPLLRPSISLEVYCFPRVPEKFFVTDFTNKCLVIYELSPSLIFGD